MSKVLLAAGLDLLREAERAEMEADRLYEHIIKSGDKIKDFTPVREGLRNSYQKWIKALETVNFVRRAAIEAERLNKLRKQLAKLDKLQQQQPGDGDGAGVGSSEAADGGSSAASGLVGDRARDKLELNQKRGLAACSDEIIRNGVPYEIVTLCDQRMQAGFEHCERIRHKESSLLLAIRDADAQKDDCSRSRPGYAVAQVLAFRDPSPNTSGPGEGLLQGNYTVTVPVVDGSYQVLVKNWTDLLVASPDVTCQVVATWRPSNGSNVMEKKQYSGPCPPGTAFLRSIGIVGTDGSIFVHVNSAGMRHSRIEVIVRRLVPATISSPQQQQQQQQQQHASASDIISTNGVPGDDATKLSSAPACGGGGAGAVVGGNDLAMLLPPIVPLGGVPQHQVPQSSAVYGTVIENPQSQLPEQQEQRQDESQEQQQELPPSQQPQQKQQQQQTAATTSFCSALNSAPQQVKETILQLINCIEEEFPKEVIVPVDVSLDNDDEDDNNHGNTGDNDKKPTLRETEKKLLEQESNKRTQQEKEFETFLMELPPPTNLFGDDDDHDDSEGATNRNAADDMIMHLVQNLGANLGDLKEMEEQMMGLDEDYDYG